MHSRDKSAKAGSSRSSTDMDSEMDYFKIKKEIGFLTSSHMSWKDKKDIQNRKVVSLGGKSQKKQRLPLSVARPIMKKQKEREQKMVLESQRFGGVSSSNNSRRKSSWNRRPEDQVLRSSEGFFKKGVLDVKHLLGRAPPRNSEFRSCDFGNELGGGGGKGRKKVGKKNSKNKKKGGGKKQRH